MVLLLSSKDILVLFSLRNSLLQSLATNTIIIMIVDTELVWSLSLPK